MTFFERSDNNPLFVGIHPNRFSFFSEILFKKNRNRFKLIEFFSLMHDRIACKLFLYFVVRFQSRNESILKLVLVFLLFFPLLVWEFVPPKKGDQSFCKREPGKSIVFISPDSITDKCFLAIGASMQITWNLEFRTGYWVRQLSAAFKRVKRRNLPLCFAGNVEESRCFTIESFLNDPGELDAPPESNLSLSNSWRSIVLKIG